MKLTDFEYYMGEEISEQGRKLFKKGRVKFRIHSGIWHGFDVKDSKMYDVTFFMRENLLIFSEGCTCPREYHFCKHMAACFYYLRNELNVQKESPLNEFIRKNPELAEKRDKLTIIKKYMQRVLGKVKKGGIVESGKMIDLYVGYEAVLEYLKTVFDLQKDKPELLKICLYLVNTINRTKFNNDIANSEILICFYTIINFVREFVKEPDDELFLLIYSELINPKNDYDFEEVELVSLACPLPKTDLNKHKMKKYLEYLIETDKYPFIYEKLRDIYFTDIYK